ncbi:serine hydrolase domain-containing protein [Pontibacter sp. MBLB2868]|uniref:serine hydrolase domain-containing protein n=1 Tax=Pontibacter sp. MBLB2868 TaxID=3451555 RepID=UPI003F753141
MTRCFIAFLVGLSLFSCQETKKDKPQLVSHPKKQETTRQKVVVPASFTKKTATKLGTQLDSIFTYFNKRKGFNGTVLVTKYDRVIYKGAFGYADFQHKDTLNTQTAFQLASVSKQFTAMAIMILKEQGKLSYDDSVQQYIPDFPYQGITIRALLTHRSGLANYTYFSDELWPDRSVPITNGDVLQLMAVHHPREYFPPNTRFDYSNTGYMLLASIVEKASGVPFATFMQKQIFEPLHMNNTFTYNDSLNTQQENVAIGHVGGRRKKLPDYLDTVLGDKGVYSTVEDLYKWDQALYTEKLVKQETLQEAFTGSRLRKHKDEDYGFGWRIRPLDNGDTVVYHAGWWHGYNSYLLRNPKDHSALIVLTNVSNGSLRYMKELQHFLYPAQPVQDNGNSDTSKVTHTALNQ